MRIRTLLLAVVTALVVPMLGNAPAQAAVPGTPTLSLLDSSVAGHLKGSVSSPGGPFVWIHLGSTDASLDPATVVELAGSSGTFDVETWGYQGPTAIFVRACTTNDWDAECSEEVQAPGSFTPTDVAPSSVTWSQDLTVGPNQPITANTSDAGGGRLVAPWVPTGGTASEYADALNRSGQTTMTSTDGIGQYDVRRCSTEGRRCVSYPALASPAYHVRTVLPLAAAPIVPVSNANPTTTVTLTTSSGLTGADYDVTWAVAVDWQPTTVSGSRPSTPLPSSGTIQFPVDGSQLPDLWYYRVVGTVRIRVPGYGEYIQQIGSAAGGTMFRVDRVNAVTSIKPRVSLIWPNIRHTDRPGSTRIDVVQSDHNEQNHIVITRNGTVVRTLPEMTGSTPNVTWDGRDDAGNAVPTGTYTLGARDIAGNVGSVTATVKVDARRRVLKTYTRTVTPRASLLEAYVGRCSTLRRPSARGWSGSLGFYAGTKCGTRTWKASAVSTMHGIRLPASDKDVQLTVKIYGGAARSKPRSLAWIRYLNTGGRWGNDHLQNAKLTTHVSDYVDTKLYVQKNRAFIWGFYTAGGYRYDVGKYTVVLRYYVLQ